MGFSKTHTMVGSQEDFEKRGLIPRSLEQIFDTGQFHKKSGWTYKVEVSMVELSRHGYFDLSSKKDKIETPNLSKKVNFVFERCFTAFPDGYSKKVIGLYEDLIKFSIS